MKAEDANSNNMLDFFQTSLLGKRQKHLCSKISDDGFTRQQIKLPNRVPSKTRLKIEEKAARSLASLHQASHTSSSPLRKSLHPTPSLGHHSVPLDIQRVNDFLFLFLKNH
jgi:hypothetical protein